MDRAVASLTVLGGQEFNFPHFFLKFRSIFPQTLLIFFLICHVCPPGKALATPLVMEVLPFFIDNNCHQSLAIYWVISGVTYHSQESDYQKCCAKIVDFCNNMLDCDTKFGIKFHHVISKTDAYLYDALNGKIFNNISSPFTVEETASAILVQWSAERYEYIRKIWFNDLDGNVFPAYSLWPQYIRHVFLEGTSGSKESF